LVICGLIFQRFALGSTCGRKFEKGELAINATRFLGYDKNDQGELAINPSQAAIVKRIFTDCVAGKGSFVIAKELNNEGAPTVAGSRWHSSTVLGILKNEKYKGDVKLQKTFSKDHMTKKKCVNRGELESYYLQDSHEPIVSREIWEEAKELMSARAEAKGNVESKKAEYQNRYPLTGLLYCRKCGAPLRRRVWNSNNASKKIVWQCSNYVLHGKESCSGTVIDGTVIDRMNIQKKTEVEEVIKIGQKHYRYSGKSQ